MEKEEHKAEKENITHLKINESKKSKQVTEKDYLLAILIASIIVISYFAYVNFAPKDFLQKLTQKQIKIEVTSIGADCKDCFDLTPIEKSFEKNNTKVIKKNLNYDSDEAKKIIEKYGIKSVPALIAFSKDINKLAIDKNFFAIGKDYALFDKSVPYLDLASGKLEGKVTLKEVYTDCKDCASLAQIEEQLKALGVKTEIYNKIDSKSEEGKKLIKDNNLSFFPSLLISKDIEKYWWFFNQSKETFLEKENYYLFNIPILPYQDANGNIKGKVSLIYITDKSCTDCFNVTDLKAAFNRIGVYINDERYVDVSSEEGKTFVKNYKIDAAPTVILSKEIGDYESLKKTLEQVGSFETDGKFVFRKLDVLNVKYKKLNE